MIISLRIKNFYSLRDESVIDFTADMSNKTLRDSLPGNLIEFSGDSFLNIIGLFGSNAAGKSNIIKAVDYCRNLILNSHLNNEGDSLSYEPFKFDNSNPSEFHIQFVTDGVEYEYSFALFNGVITSESLYYYPHKRRSKVFIRENSDNYSFKKGVIKRPNEVAANTGPKTLFLSRASSMNKEIARTVYRFFLNQMVVGLDMIDLTKLESADFEKNKRTLLKGLEVGDSDIIDIQLQEIQPGQYRLISYHRENPSIPFDFIKEESEGTKRLLTILMLIINKVSLDTTFFIDEFDLKLHLRLAEFILDLIRATGTSQIVFTSHNPWLIDKNSLRPEQIIFVNKDSEGNSEFSPLYDFEGLEKNTDPRHAYLLGRFDAIPYIGNVRDVISLMLGDK